MVCVLNTPSNSRCRRTAAVRRAWAWSSDRSVRSYSLVMTVALIESLNIH